MATWVGATMRILGVVAAGAVGAMCTLYFSPPAAPVTSSPPRATSSTKQPEAAVAATSKLLNRRLNGLEERVGALEQEPAAEAALRGEDEAPTRSAHSDPERDAPPASYYYERHDKNIANHLSEPIDPHWGPVFTQTLRSDAERLAKVGRYTVNTAECRDSTCRLSVHWDKFGTARASYQELLHQPLALNCERTILVPERAPDEPVDATLLLDCAEWKANGSELLDVDSSQAALVPPVDQP